MSYRLIDANALAIKYPEVNDMPCIYLDLPNGLDNKHHGTLSDNPTNGDIIKAMFPQDEEIILDTIIFKLNGSKCRVSADWWNSPYKRGDTDGSNN